MPPTAFATLGVWEILIIVVALAVLLGVPMVAVALYMWIRRIISRCRKARRRQARSPAEASES